jgi:selenophosphate synthase
MASSVTFTEYNGAGATATASRSEMNLKAIDDSTTAYGSSPIVAGNNSMTKYQAAVHTGTYDSLSAAGYKISANNPESGYSIVGSVVTSFTTPATTASGDSAMSTSGISANFNNSTTPFGTGTSTYTTGGTIYVNALRLQAQTLSSCAPGDTTQETITYYWTEN